MSLNPESLKPVLLCAFGLLAAFFMPWVHWRQVPVRKAKPDKARQPTGFASGQAPALGRFERSRKEPAAYHNSKSTAHWTMVSTIPAFARHLPIGALQLANRRLTPYRAFSPLHAVGFSTPTPYRLVPT